MEKKEEVILQFLKSDEGISVTVCGTETLNLLMGIAQTIQMISGQSKKDTKDIVNDINKILDILKEKEEEN